MFGRPKFADAAVLSGEINNRINASIFALKANYPNLSTTDTQIIMTWIFALVIHIVILWGRTDQDALRSAGHDFGQMMGRITGEGLWTIDESLAESEYCDSLLTTIFVLPDHSQIELVFSTYFISLLHRHPDSTISRDDFIQFGVTNTLDNLTRLQNGGYLKIK